MKIIIAGTRTYNNYKELKDACDYLIQKIKVNPKDIEIISGHAKGVDTLGEKYAKEKKYKLKIFPADWDKHGKQAGIIRNKQMISYAGKDGIVIAIWNMLSPGTKHMVDTAYDKGLKVYCLCYDEEEV